MRIPPPRSPGSVSPDPSIAAPYDAETFADLLIDDPGHALRRAVATGSNDTPDLHAHSSVNPCTPRAARRKDRS